MYQTQAGLLTIGEFVTFLAALLLIMPPLRHLAGLNASFVMMTVAAESLFATLDLQEEPDQGTEQLSKDIKNVVFDSVGLRYPGAERDAVESVSFAIEKQGYCSRWALGIGEDDHRQYASEVLESNIRTDSY